MLQPGRCAQRDGVSAAAALPGQPGRTTWKPWSALQQQRAGGQAPVPIFAMALVFVFLVLAAQYESWIVPFAVILCIPFAVFGAFLGLLDAQHGQRHLCAGRTGDADRTRQPRTRSLIVGVRAPLAPCAACRSSRRRSKGARLRLRAILMTSFAFILGAVPLAIATGAGAVARQVLGTTVVFRHAGRDHDRHFSGCPVFYVVLQGLVDRVSGLHGEDADSPRRPGREPREMSRRLRHCICGSALLAGCALGPDYHRPALEVPAAFRDVAPPAAASAAADSASFGDGRRRGGCPGIRRRLPLLENAIKNNFDVKIAVARIDEARAQLGSTRLSYLPRYW